MQEASLGRALDPGNLKLAPRVFPLFHSTVLRHAPASANHKDCERSTGFFQPAKTADSPPADRESPTSTSELSRLLGGSRGIDGPWVLTLLIPKLGICVSVSGMSHLLALT